MPAINTRMLENMKLVEIKALNAMNTARFNYWHSLSLEVESDPHGAEWRKAFRKYQLATQHWQRCVHNTDTAAKPLNHPAQG